MVDIATAVPGVVAARMTGAGFGGCTINLVRHDAIDALRQAVEREYPALTGLTPMVLPVRAVNGAGHAVSATSGAWRRLQTGNVQHYALSFLAGALALLGYLMAH